MRGDRMFFTEYVDPFPNWKEKYCWRLTHTGDRERDRLTITEDSRRYEELMEKTHQSSEWYKAELERMGVKIRTTPRIWYAIEQ